MSHSTEKLGLNTLLVDQNNPRFPPTNSQSDAIDQMLSRIPDKILAMARDISKRGLNPTVVPAVFTTADGRNIVKDGNRRITSIKVLMNPSLVKDKSLRKKFEKISANINRSELKYITCIQFDDEAEADQWVENNHQSDQKSGIGQETWGAIPKMRDSRNKGKSVPVLDMYEMVQKQAPEITDESFSITTFDRVVKSATFKELTGWKIEKEKLILNMPEADFIEAITEIAKDINDPEREDHIDSRSINDTENITEYLSRKQEKGFFSGIGEGSSISILSGKKEKEKGKGRKTSRSKVSLIPPDIEWSIDNPRIRDIYDELRSISLYKHPNAVSILFRAFIEMSTKWYVSTHNVQDDRHLDNRMKKISAFLFKEGRITDETNRSVKAILEHTNDSVAFDQELNQFGHNYELNPTPEGLIQTFNSIRSLLEAMFEKETQEDVEKLVE